MFYSLLQEGSYLETGKNSKTKKEAINDGIDYLTSDGSCSNPSKLKRMSLGDKELYLNMSGGITVEEHGERLPEEFEEVDHRANNRSPFGIGS